MTDKDRIMEEISKDAPGMYGFFHGIIMGSMASATKLTKYIVENRIRNNEQLDDEDIYEIYQMSFLRVMDSTQDNMSGMMGGPDQEQL